MRWHGDNEIDTMKQISGLHNFTLTVVEVVQHGWETVHSGSGTALSLLRPSHSPHLSRERVTPPWNYQAKCLCSAPCTHYYLLLFSWRSPPQQALSLSWT